MKILHIIQRYHPAIGGAEAWCRNVSRYLASLRIPTGVVCINLFNIEEFFRDLSEGEKFVALGPYDLDNGVIIHRYRLSSFASKGVWARLFKFCLYKTPLSRLELSSIIRHSPHSLEMYSKLIKEARDSDIIHLHTLPYFHTLAGFLAARLTGKKIVITPHFHPGNPYYEKKIFYRMMSCCDAVISMSAYEKDYLVSKGVPADKIHIVGNSILDTDFSDAADYEYFKSRLLAKYGITQSTKKIIF